MDDKTINTFTLTFGALSDGTFIICRIIVEYILQKDEFKHGIDMILAALECNKYSIQFKPFIQSINTMKIIFKKWLQYINERDIKSQINKNNLTKRECFRNRVQLSSICFYVIT